LVAPGASCWGVRENNPVTPGGSRWRTRSEDWTPSRTPGCRCFLRILWGWP